MYSIITENDDSKWDDKTGEYYHFPERYLRILQPGTRIIYYKGKIKKPEYFGCGIIGKVTLAPKDPEDNTSKSSSYYATIDDYVSFKIKPIAKLGHNKYIEKIPDNKKKNYWRNAVRKIDDETYSTILALANVNISLEYEISDDLVSSQEGNKKKIYTTIYERDPKLRKQVIAKKGTTCVCCGFNFSNFYGEIGNGYTHVHHIKPLHVYGGESIQVTIDDLEPVCANCHAMIHRKKSSTLSIEQLRQFIQENRTIN
ncbi:HNH endonuclease [Entomomonas asaccharolytica]|uniref:HNH endonuclease n=1 Tax=Entomomonas asaccharolytica TaxID=2785331 RepID=A0A974NDQ4_9GAMM|nr:HNH endonuclease [Entomomonas asaccharolytica]QQP84674.1 HNH endonuclease [Entomomonas asaccharolytica]